MPTTNHEVACGELVAEALGMSRPRQVLAGQFYLITRTCTQRQYLLRPDESTNNAFVYCLGEAAKRFDINVVLPMVESNHHHTIIFDPRGNYPRFIEHLHKMVARCMNARWGRSENLWAAEETCVTQLLDRDTVIAKLIYCAANPVQDLLVEHALQWRGVNGYKHFLNGTPMIARRPKWFFRDKGTMPETVTLTLVIPEVLGPATAVIAEVRAGVEAVEQKMLEHRRKTGARVLGAKKACEVHWSDSPTVPRPKKSLRPRFAGVPGVRIPALIAYKAFLAAYSYARRLWRQGHEVEFPEGTYWLARHTPILAEARSASS